MNYLEDVPIIKQALFFLREAGSSNGIKITDTGAIGRNFVQALWDKHLKKSENEIRFRPTRERECPEATRIYFLLSESKYVRKFKGKICLTKKGEVALSLDNHESLYFDLLSVAIQKWNWGYEDLYPEFEFIQQGALYLIERAYSLPSTGVTPLQIYDDVLAPVLSAHSEDEKEQICRCLMVRFFYRFAIPFGIFKDDKDDFLLNKNSDDVFEKTEFFRSEFMQIMSEKPSTIKSTPKKSRTKNGFTPSAQKFWDKLNPKIRVRLMNNAFCFTCKGETGIGNPSGDIKSGDLVLSGVCTKCGEPVARLIENDWLHQ